MAYWQSLTFAGANQKLGDLFGALKASPTGIVIAAIPSFFMLAIFYSLAIHMRYSLGAWPSSIGDRGFPAALSTHGRWAWNYFEWLLVASMVVVPAGIMVCLLVARWRRFVPCLALHAMYYLICWGLMLLAPSPFLYWWWD